MRTLLGIPVTPSNDSHDAEFFCQDKTTYFIICLKSKNLGLQDVFFGHERQWVPSLTLASTVLIVPHSGSMLSPLHKFLLPKLKITCTFALVMCSVPTKIGGINLRSLEITSRVQSTQHLVSLFTNDTTFKLLLLSVIQNYQLEFGVEKLFFLLRMLSCMI